MQPVPQANIQMPVSRISILARLVPSLSYLIGMGGAALGSMMIVRTFEGMRNAETAGIAAVAGGLSEASQAMAIALYFAIVVGAIGMVIMIARALMATATASPSGWLFIVTGGLSLIPLAIVWKAESLIVEALSPGNHNIAQSAAAIQMCLTLTFLTSGILSLILLVALLVPLPSILRAKRKWAPIVVLLLIEFALIGMAVAFQLRASWLFQVRMNERF
ncbi:MAG: hypothetical protein QOK48_1193 [Blastocatellia bacterium]|nr:hypothetical protein [Blastocatellia bacterium]